MSWNRNQDDNSFQSLINPGGDEFEYYSGDDVDRLLKAWSRIDPLLGLLLPTAGMLYLMTHFREGEYLLFSGHTVSTMQVGLATVVLVSVLAVWLALFRTEYRRQVTARIRDNHGKIRELLQLGALPDIRAHVDAQWQRYLGDPTGEWWQRLNSLTRELDWYIENPQYLMRPQWLIHRVVMRLFIISLILFALNGVTPPSGQHADPIDFALRLAVALIGMTIVSCRITLSIRRQVHARQLLKFRQFNQLD